MYNNKNNPNINTLLSISDDDLFKHWYEKIWIWKKINTLIKTEIKPSSMDFLKKLEININKINQIANFWEFSLVSINNITTKKSKYWEFLVIEWIDKNWNMLSIELEIQDDSYIYNKIIFHQKIEEKELLKKLYEVMNPNEVLTPEQYISLIELKNTGISVNGQNNFLVKFLKYNISNWLIKINIPLYIEKYNNKFEENLFEKNWNYFINWYPNWVKIID